MKNKIIIAIICIVIIGITSFVISTFVLNYLDDKDKKEETQVEKVFNGSYDSETDTYYLHKSELELPDEKIYTIAQVKALQGTESEEFKTNFGYAHQSLEALLTGAVKTLKDKESPYWEDYTEVVRREVEYEYPPNPDGTKSYYMTDGGFSKVLNEIRELLNDIKNETVKTDIEKVCTLLEEGIDNHEIGKFFEAHEIMHDYDYWVINAPPSFVSIAPYDWTGTRTYFGKASIIKEQGNNI